MINIIIIPTILITILSLALFPLIEQNKENNESWSPFECGFNNLSNNRNPFSIQFFLIALAFLVFDVEILLLFPYATTTSSHNQNTEILILLTILMLGLLYEINTNNLEWNN